MNADRSDPANATPAAICTCPPVLSAFICVHLRLDSSPFSFGAG
jgi:hypothetical protein